MIKIAILLFFPLLSLAQRDSIPKRSDFIFKGPIYSNPNPKLVRDENRKPKDSLHFIILTSRYISGGTFDKIVWDPREKINYWEQFYPNGQLKETGAMTKDEIICFGKWTYYLENGKLDTIIDYDKKLPIPYLKALDIARSHDFKMPGIDVDITTYDHKLYWQFRKWIMRHGDGISSTILISTTDGSMVKAAEEIERHN